MIELSNPAARVPMRASSADNSQIESEVKDTLNREGAMALAKRLQQYWHDRGYPAARFWAEPIEERFAKVGTYEIYRVVCNLVNALPPKYQDNP
jgi:hypothetical protein